jgi:hypothetical protein
MDSALTFGVLLAMLAYFRGEKSWGPPLLIGGWIPASFSRALARATCGEFPSTLKKATGFFFAGKKCFLLTAKHTGFSILGRFSILLSASPSTLSFR